VVAAYFDNRRDIDLFVLRRDRPALLKNMRDGTFKDQAAELGLVATGPFTCAAAGDVNKDGYTDFFLGAKGASSLALSDGRGAFAVVPAPPAAAGALAAQLVDYDNDGLLDLLVVTAKGPRLLRGLGASWADVSATAFTAPCRMRLAATHPGVTVEEVFGARARRGRRHDDDLVCSLASAAPAGIDWRAEPCPTRVGYILAVPAADCQARAARSLMPAAAAAAARLLPSIRFSRSRRTCASVTIRPPTNSLAQAGSDCRWTGKSNCRQTGNSNCRQSRQREVMSNRVQRTLTMMHPGVFF